MTSQIKPQPGPQEAFLSTPADIAIYGGSAGGGKTFALLLESLRHTPNVDDFYAVYFRRNTTQVKNPGGLWDESSKIFPLAGGEPVAHVLEWRWNKRHSKVKFAHLEHETTKFDWQGSQVPLICFDELTHFTQSQFFYMMSRNRSMCGVRPYIRATCNPDADSWVAEFIAWWINQETGFPIPERSGKIRWFVRISDKMLWGDSRQELVEKYGDPDLPLDHEQQVQPKSLTFIPAKLTDNPALLKADPSYLANLKAQNQVEQARLLGGNWKIRPAAGLYFKREWVNVVDVPPTDLEIVRYWDLAATEKTETNDPDWTIGWKMGRQRKTGQLYVLNVIRMRDTPFIVETAVENAAAQDGYEVRIGIPQDPGQAGKSQSKTFIKNLSGYMVRSQPERGDKTVRFGPFSAQCQAGNVTFVRAPWNNEVFDALEGFPDGAHDDEADAAAGAYDMLNSGSLGLHDYMRELNNEVMQPRIAQEQAQAAIEAAQKITASSAVKNFIDALS